MDAMSYPVVPVAESNTHYLARKHPVLASLAASKAISHDGTTGSPAVTADAVLRQTLDEFDTIASINLRPLSFESIRSPKLPSLHDLIVGLEAITVLVLVELAIRGVLDRLTNLDGHGRE